ncbi:hypothetical protein CH298_03585 [Rhodococcoides fascians]|uniref:hypothetical protein n=1 Tax=Rhodococcoides fascians TaxID=1828 RepID=UPI000B9B0394|nr:hypothetical protein [Rhodococcus fascians]OZE92605.1 hypothetical protein CH303_03585 [Rhodococcus fascians]OZF23238.1 hypothetical protein CH298_03585 [Rhodococcus fascians]OZF24952.1 hypothetical protein CH297_03585 [Rhodococcus fascians]OZF72547.1 hypothetical protein CH308_03590 [Rhodococcus fascians]OZF73845.1 hypothetical protein CH307_03590 [Rhodococcus fascians]
MTATTTTPNAAPSEAPSADETGADDIQATSESTDSSDPQESAEETAGKGNANAEAARWRTKLRAAEGERNQLAATLETLQRGEVARLAGTILAQGGDLLELGGHELADLLSGDGTVDPERVTELAKELQLSRPGLSKHGVGATHQNFGQVAVGPAASRGGSKASWGAVLKGR